uniref:Uncharacterized protein n=1 Tax=Arundo donax TaxID=35708 RepID=A0A0A9AC42_ARUDO
MIDAMQAPLGLSDIIRQLPILLLAHPKWCRDDLPCVPFHIHHSYLTLSPRQDLIQHAIKIGTKHVRHHVKVNPVTFAMTPHPRF